MERELSAAPASPQQTVVKSYNVVVEGLDGSGKSSLVNQLSQQLQEKYSKKGATVVAWATPTASLSAVRPVFDKRGGPVARAFYMVSNYMLQYELQQLEQQQKQLDSNTSSHCQADRLLVVIIDRWYSSTVAYSVSWKNTKGGIESVDALESSIFRWPGDLRPPNVLFLLQVDDGIRRDRVQSRAKANSSNGEPKQDYNPWDERLDKDENLGRRIMCSFERVAEGLVSSETTRVVRLDANRSKDGVIQDALLAIEGIIPFN
jgi:thymidylate kinase